MALKNLEIWQGTWAVVTQHYHGKLIIAGSLNDAEHEPLKSNLVLQKEHHEDSEYNFCLAIPLQTVDSDKIVFSGRDKRTGGEKSYGIEVLLVRYSQPTGSGNRAVGYFQLAAEPERAEGHKQPIEATKE